jgi:choice-of-anchor A domain-containing protein
MKKRTVIPRKPARVYGAAVGAAFAAILGFASTAHADFISGTLDGAGSGDFAILALDTSTHLHINGPAPQGTIGNVGVVNPTADFHLDGPNSITGNVLVSGSASQFQNTGTVSGSILANQSATLNAANTAALNAASTFAGLSGTSEGAINGTTTINATNPGGVNVFDVTGINLGNGQTLTLNGPPGTEFIVDDSGGITLNSGRILLTGGVTAADVVFNITGNGSISTSGGLNNESVLNGILLAPNSSVALSPGQINGELIAGGSIDLASGAEVIGVPPIPEPSTWVMVLGSLGLLRCLQRVRRVC